MLTSSATWNPLPHVQVLGGDREVSIKLAVAQTTRAKKKKIWSSFKLRPASSREEVLADGPVSRGHERLPAGPRGYLDPLQKDCRRLLLGHSAVAKQLFVVPSVLTPCWSTGVNTGWCFGHKSRSR